MIGGYHIGQVIILIRLIQLIKHHLKFSIQACKLILILLAFISNCIYFSVTILDARSIYGSSIQSMTKDFKQFFIIYVCLAVANSIFTLLRAFTFAYGGIEAARKLHKLLFNKMLKCRISFFDITPSGRILNRFSTDTWSVDDSLPFILNILLAHTFSLLGTLILSCYGLPEFILLLVPLTIFYYFIQVFNLF